MVKESNEVVECIFYISLFSTYLYATFTSAGAFESISKMLLSATPLLHSTVFLFPVSGLLARVLSSLLWSAVFSGGAKKWYPYSKAIQKQMEGLTFGKVAKEINLSIISFPPCILDFLETFLNNFMNICQINITMYFQ